MENLSITKVNAGTAFNVIPESSYIGGTLRSTNQKERNYLLKKIEETSKNTALAHNCNIEFRRKKKTGEYIWVQGTNIYNESYE